MTNREPILIQNCSRSNSKSKIIKDSSMTKMSIRTRSMKMMRQCSTQIVNSTTCFPLMASRNNGPAPFAQVATQLTHRKGRIIPRKQLAEANKAKSSQVSRSNQAISMSSHMHRKSKCRELIHNLDLTSLFHHRGRGHIEKPNKTKSCLTAKFSKSFSLSFDQVTRKLNRRAT